MFKIFSKKKTKEITSVARGGRKVSEKVRVFDTIIKPSITEKSSILSEANVYTFYVRKDATKEDVKEAIEAVYKVVPKKVKILRTVSKPRRIRVRGREREFGSTCVLKKAYVHLKEGDKIQLG